MFQTAKSLVAVVVRCRKEESRCSRANYRIWGRGEGPWGGESSYSDQTESREDESIVLH